VNWLSYEFKYKPGDVNRRPDFIAPVQPRLDWQMWFAALSDYRQNPWFVNFCARLPQGSPDVLALLAKNPFADHPRVMFVPNFMIFISPASPGGARRARAGSVNSSGNTCRRFHLMNNLAWKHP